MSIPMYQTSVPIFVQALGGLTNVLDIGEAHCAAHNIDESVLLKLRVYPDMFHMALQAKTTLYHSGGAVAQLIGQEVNDYFGADESSFAVLKKQATDALEFIQGVSPEQFDGSESRQIELRAQTLTGETYLMHFAIPQVFFSPHDSVQHTAQCWGRSWQARLFGRDSQLIRHGWGRPTVVIPKLVRGS